MQGPTWQDLEQAVRDTASLIWNVHASPDEINGVRVDAVLKIRPDHWVCIEVSKEDTLAKLRVDLAKFQTIRPYLFSQNVYVECIFTTLTEPTASLITSGGGSNIQVCSLESLKRRFFDYSKYAFRRQRRPFGSSVDPYSGESDKFRYVPVKYLSQDSAKAYSIHDIATEIRTGRTVVLLGNFGTGKSRCLREVFLSLCDQSDSENKYPIAIDLRDNWGVKRGTEVIRRHFEDIGLSDLIDPCLKLQEVGALSFLLDGFDEIGTQSWTDNPQRLREIRRKSLEGIRDLIQKTAGGKLITGRPHYFDSEAEMFESLGLNKGRTLTVVCAEEFTLDEMRQYIAEINPSLCFPDWIPKRPLMCQILATLDSEAVKRISDSEESNSEAWRLLIGAICKRESNINPALDDETILNVLRRIARKTRTKTTPSGPISLDEIVSSFEDVVGARPVDESMTMLQRLPPLGRLGSETTDRYFVDEYILDGLLATDLMLTVRGSGFDKARSEKWCNPLGWLGSHLVAEDICKADHYGLYMRAAKLAADHGNQQMAADIVSSFLMTNKTEIDFHDLWLESCSIRWLWMCYTEVKNLRITNCVIETLDISEASQVNVSVSSCAIAWVYGVTSQEGLPRWVSQCTIDHYETVDTLDRIRAIGLTRPKQIFLMIIHKVYFQPGKGRKEAALMRGYGASADRKLFDKIVNLLLTNEILTRSRGDDGWVYHPKRSLTGRMRLIMDRLTLCDDPLWRDLEKFGP